VRRAAVLVDAFLEGFYAFFYPRIFFFLRIPFDRDIVSQVPALKSPDRQEVGLKLGDQLDGCLQAIPGVVFLLLFGAKPKDVSDDTPEPAQQKELHHEAPRINLADGGLSQVAPLFFRGEPGGVWEHDAENGDDDDSVNELAVEITESVHAATS